jgi:exodeoxyribonuclease-3
VKTWDNELMKIVSWNVNGIRAAFRKGFSTFLQDIDADVICLQELKADDLALANSMSAIEGYHLYKNTAAKKGYSGVAVLSRRKATCLYTSLGHTRFDQEGRLLCLQIDDISIINIYMPHGGRTKEHLEYKLEAYTLLLKLSNALVNAPAILIGDFNVARDVLDLARPRQNIRNIMFTTEERKQLELLTKCGWVDTYRQYNPSRQQYTWWPWIANARSRNIGWRIDYVFASKTLWQRVESGFIRDDIVGSDHCPTGITLK